MGFDWFSVSDHFQESPPQGGDLDCFEAVTVDHLSNGRLECGIGAGSHAHEYEAFGIPFEKIGVREDMLEEGLPAGHRQAGPGDGGRVSGCGVERLNIGLGQGPYDWEALHAYAEVVLPAFGAKRPA
jgi:hypothetical protein